MAPLRNTLGKSIGNLIKVGRSKDLAGSGTGGAAKDDQINSKNIGGVLILDSTATGGTKYTYSGKTIHRFTNTGKFIAGNSFSQTCEYFIVAGGGGGAGTYHGGGGGAGGWKAGTSGTIGPYQEITVTVGGGGPGGEEPNKQSPGFPGSDSSLALPTGTVTAAGGGGGGGYNIPNAPYKIGGSGGGGCGNGPPPAARTGGTGNLFPDESPLHPAPAPGQGNNGGNGGPGAWANAAGGGGAGAAGSHGNGPHPAGGPGTTAGPGGLGIIIPATFRDPTNSIGAAGPGSPAFWVCGGGGGANSGSGEGGYGGGGPNYPTPWSGGGRGGDDPAEGQPGPSYGGGGGGAGRRHPNDNLYSGGSGHPGVILIAYPTP